MKKILIATTALTMMAGAASADVTLSGGGYFGLKYNSKPGTNGSGVAYQKTQLIKRMQVDIKGSKTTDSGLTFHGKFRVRSSAYLATTTPVNAGQVGITAGGLDVSVGNVSDAIDALSLYWNSEVGICGCGGETLNWTPFKGYSSQGGAGTEGVLATYTMGDLVVRGSYMSAGNTTGLKSEQGVSVAYKVGALSMEAGYVTQSASATADGYSGATLVFEYALGNSNIGIAGGRNTTKPMGGGANTSINAVTVYGNTTMGATTLKAFVSHANNLPATNTSTTYGVGASYDLGSGAAIVGSVRRDWNKANYADIGVTFSF